MEKKLLNRNKAREFQRGNENNILSKELDRIKNVLSSWIIKEKNTISDKIRSSSHDCKSELTINTFIEINCYLKNLNTIEPLEFIKDHGFYVTTHISGKHLYLIIKWSNGNSTYQPSIKLNDIITADEAREIFEKSLLEYKNSIINTINLIDFENVDRIISENINNLIYSTIEGYLPLYCVFNVDGNMDSHKVALAHNDYSFKNLSIYYKIKILST